MASSTVIVQAMELVDYIQMWIFWEETCHSYVRKLPEQPSDLMLREVE
jgi:hypothetical protein